MTAKVIARTVPAWSHAQGPSLRSEFARDVQRFLGTSVAEQARPFLESAPVERLASAWHRIPYVERFENLFDPQWTLGVLPLTSKDLIRHAFGKSLRCGVLLEIRSRKRAARDRFDLLSDVAWIALLKDSDQVIDNLLQSGWVVLGCPSRRIAELLQSRVKPEWIRCTVLGSPAEV